jgi:hypothetical protein
MNFSDQPPSKQWALLKFRGEKFAEVWFKPADEPLSLTFRIPRESFQIPGVVQLLTTEKLLKAVSISTADIQSWGHGGASHAEAEGSDEELGQPLPAPTDGVGHRYVYINLKPAEEPADIAVEDPQESAVEALPEPTQRDALTESDGSTTPAGAKWEDLDARWNAILGVEASIDNLRITVEGMQSEMETAAKQTLTTEVKINALHADVATWTKAKSRVHFAVPKIREFVHRATWVMGTPERKKLEELFKDEVRPELSTREMIKVYDELENLLKDRQILSGQGGGVYQECKNIASGIQMALRNLQSNAEARADKKRRAGKPKGKFFKHIRKWSGAD